MDSSQGFERRRGQGRGQKRGRGRGGRGRDRSSPSFPTSHAEIQPQKETEESEESEEVQLVTQLLKESQISTNPTAPYVTPTPSFQPQPYQPILRETTETKQPLQSPRTQQPYQPFQQMPPYPLSGITPSVQPIQPIPTTTQVTVKPSKMELGTGQIPVSTITTSTVSTSSPSPATKLQKKARTRELGKPDNDVLVAKRPATSTEPLSGRVIQLLTNHFRFELKPQTMYQYSVEFSPELDSIRSRNKIIEEYKNIFGTFVFDGAMLFLLKDVVFLELNATFQDVNYAIRITKTNELPPGMISFQLCNLMFRKNLKRLKLILIGRNYFDPSKAISIPQHKVQLWPGFLTAVNPTEAGITLVADVTHKVLRTDTVLDLLQELKDARGRIWKQIAEDQIATQIVLTRYNNRTYRVDGIVWEKSPKSTFQKRSGDRFSYMEYYLQSYGIKITDQYQPLLVHKQRPKKSNNDNTNNQEDLIYLIPELCSMTGISERMKSDFNVMKDISIHTRVVPDRRAHELESFIAGFSQNQEIANDLNLWGMNIASNMLSVTGRISDSEKISFKNNSQLSDPRTAEWAGMCKNSELLYPIPLNNWLLVCSSKVSKIAKDFAFNLAKVAASVGFKINKPNVVELQDDRKAAFIDAMKQNITPKSQFVVCILPNSAKDRYDAIKQLCCIELPIPSQCVLTKSVKEGKNLLSVCNKIAFQVNCKLGGELWKLDIKIGKAMIVGIDVYHDTLNRGLSVAAFCASYNPNFTKYHSFPIFQQTGQELVYGLKRCMGASLRKFFEVNRFLPDTIIVFRDGVGDGMLAAVVEHEVPQMQATFSDYPNYSPRLCVVVVKKRIHGRFFDKSGSTLQNPLPGTIVDNLCVHKDWYDFFVVSQSVRQGTVTPTHYHVVFDTTGIQPVMIQSLTYKMCHLYYNWPGTIRVPAPCQYAHKYAYLVGQALHREPSDSLVDKLFYL